MKYSLLQNSILIFLSILLKISSQETSQNQNTEADTQICGGFLEFDQNYPEIKKKIDYSKITVQSFTMDMVLKEQTNLAASGYYFLPVYENDPFLLKISGPYGMSFEPEQYIFNMDDGKSIKDYCSKDINFKFLGFAIEGQISTFGSNEGPKDINLALYNEKNQKLQSTLTIEHGYFKFKPLYPSKEQYIIRPVDKLDIFDKDYNEFKFNVEIDKENSFTRALIIRGYKLSGRVETDNGEPMEKILILIYSKNSTLVKNYNCEHKYLKSNDLIFESMKPFCIVESDKEGNFQFINIPYGNFIIKSVKKNDYLTYSLTPEKREINIKHGDYIIREPFIGGTFSIYGKVINGKGNGIPKVTIKIDGQVKAVTDKNGIYILEKMTQGNYDLEAQADDMFFEPLTNIHLSNHIDKIPDVIVTDYKLCGKIIIEATDFFSISKRTVVLQDSNSKKERRTITDQVGKYCFEVRPGSYLLFPVLTQDEKNSDLHLQPEQHKIDIIDHPVLDANFYQSKVGISGKVNCIKNCDKSIQIKLISTKNDKIQTSELNPNDFSFKFTNILSGQYKLAIIKPEWCWENEDIIVKVQNSDIKNVDFKQNGYSLFYQSQHDVEIEWLNTESNDKKDVIFDRKNEKICLPKEGKYIITPKSCYLFQEKEFVYNTDNATVIELNPKEFRTKGKIDLDNKAIQSFKKNNISKITINLHIDEIIDNNKTTYKKLQISLENIKETPFEFYTKPNTQFSILPTIELESIPKSVYETLLIMPKTKNLNVKEECNEDSNNMKFLIKTGLIIEGKVTPAMEEVEITAYNKNDNSIVANAITDKNGKYKIGPLSMDDSYELKAIKEGYKIVQSENNQFNFKCEKLSFLKVKVQDDKERPLQGVFLSLSSADRGFRVNNNTNSEGYFNFLELYSGDYYIKPLLKEYEFDQQQKLVTIKGGEHIEILLKAKRVAFSIFGKVNNLNKEKVEGLYVQAINQKTKIIQETTIDKNGEYRLKGLIPGETYSIKVKIPSSSNIEKALPISIPITLKKEDTFNVDFVVLQRSKKIDIRTYINFTDESENCPLDKINYEYVELTKPDEDDEHVIKVIPISNACSFVFRNLDKVKYHMKILEKKGKVEQTPRLISEVTVDLSDERDINNGVKIVNLNISKVKGKNGDSLNYTIYSPFFLFLLICSILKWDFTLKVIDFVIVKPLDIVTGFCDKKRR